MALSFGGISFVGTHGAVIVGPSQLQASRTKFWGVAGESEIVGLRGGRPIEAELWVHSSGYSTAEQVYNELQAMDGIIGQNADLVDSGISRIWYACTFLGFEQQQDILPIIGNQLTGSYFTRGILRFYSLRPPGS